jgi:membrane protein YdbS with pleckstrin-like domain
MNKLDPSVKSVWAIGILIKTLFYTLFTFLIEYFVLHNNLPNWTVPLGYITLLVFVTGLLMIFFYPWLAYKYWAFDIREAEIYLQRGILTRIYTTAPFSRIQHLDVEQSFIERTFGLGKLVVYTAGTRGADVAIPGLPIDYAEALRDNLKDITAEDSV